MRPPRAPGNPLVTKFFLGSIMTCFRVLAFIGVALALAGCCASGSGCYAPVPGVPTAWDGTGVQPGESTTPRRQPRTARPKTEIIVGPIEHASGASRPASSTAPTELSASEKALNDKDAADREADARLTKRLMICRNCLPPVTGTDAVGAIR
jgi:hypothetical protein